MLAFGVWVVSGLAALVASQPLDEGGGQESPVHDPLPAPAELALLPDDGGPEFNRLVFEVSPYLRQHARNPVDWWPWGPEAFEHARAADKPIFLSIGYATCHWCHVMERESFEDEEVAALLNEHFVCVKVDREERPDVDQVYMTVTQGLTGSGGWPMTVLLTPDKEPFFAGTYFPKRGGPGRTGMLELLPALARAWSEERAELVRRAAELRDWLERTTRLAPGEMPEPELLDAAFESLCASHDAQYGGFGERPKFPSPANLRFLLRYAHRARADGEAEAAAEALAMVEGQLDAMRRGGIWDHVGHGLHRYATDREWFLPHFEKMLYDQALVALVATETWQLTGDPRWRSFAAEIFDYVLRDLSAPEGGFYSAEDADSEGEEGLFYLWRPAELIDALGDEDGALAIELFGVEADGNFRDEATGRKTGESILHLGRSLAAFAVQRGDDPLELAQRVESIRRRLFDVREPRVHPFKDDKVLTDWNGLMIASLAVAGRAFDEPRYTDAATRAAQFCLSALRREDGRLMKRWRAGRAGLDGVLEDYAFLTFGLIELYQTTFDPRWLRAAVELTRRALADFEDTEQGGFFTASAAADDLIVRAKDAYDGALPSGNSVMATNLVRLARLTGETGYEERATALFRAFATPLAQHPLASPWMLGALDFAFGPTREVVVAGARDDARVERLLAAIGRRFLPHLVVVHRPPGDAPEITQLAPYTAAQLPSDGGLSVYICEDFACSAPLNDVNDVSDVERVLTALGLE